MVLSWKPFCLSWESLAHGRLKFAEIVSTSRLSVIVKLQLSRMLTAPNCPRLPTFSDAYSTKHPRRPTFSMTKLSDNKLSRTTKLSLMLTVHDNQLSRMTKLSLMLTVHDNQLSRMTNFLGQLKFLRRPTFHDDQLSETTKHPRRPKFSVTTNFCDDRFSFYNQLSTTTNCPRRSTFQVTKLSRITKETIDFLGCLQHQLSSDAYCPRQPTFSDDRLRRPNFLRFLQHQVSETIKLSR